MKKSHHGQGIQRDVLPVDAMGGYTGTQDLFMDYPMRELLIANDDTTNSMSINVIGDAGYSVSFTILPYEVLNERFYPFTEVKVTATGAWRYIVRSGIIS